MCVAKLHSLVSIAVVFGASATWAQNATLVDEGGLGYRMEIGRHERLVKARASEGVKLAPFVSDGCSGGQSAGWDLLARTFPEMAKRHGDLPPWQQCCVVHDRAYHAGGGRRADAEASYAARRHADEQLRQCVIRTGKGRAADLMSDYGLSRDQVSTLYRSVADVMYRAVRIGGAPCTGLPWRWGFGWPKCD
jgi:hypothetical protein